MICKERCIRSGNEDGNKKVYYISAVATHKNGSPRKEPFMFDIHTKEFELVNIPAQPIDVTDLLAYYNSHNSEFSTFLDTNEKRKDLRMKKKSRSTTNSHTSDLNIYELIEFFVRHKVSNYENSHFIVDELPIFYKSKTGNSCHYHYKYY